MLVYKGKLPSSKSLVNRCLLLEAIFSSFKAQWSAEAKDVVLLKEALLKFKDSSKDVSDSNTLVQFQAGFGGTTFRFLSVYLSSFKGEYKILCSKKLLERPHEDLFIFFKFQGIEFRVESDGLWIQSNGWSSVKDLEVSSTRTTQVATAVLLTALRFKEFTRLKFLSQMESDYFLMTVDLLKSLGFLVEWDSLSLKVDQNYNPLDVKKEFEVEADWSTASFLYVLSALKGDVEFLNLKKDSLQPDAVVLDILESLGVKRANFKVSSENFGTYTSKSFDIKKYPDLFPVLMVVLAFCDGEGELFGASQLVYKESNRVDEIKKLLSLCGYKTVSVDGGLKVFGCGSKILDHKEFSFDCSLDHRIFMAAYILKYMGYKINIKGSESIEKSFPEFFKFEEKYVFFNRS